MTEVSYDSGNADLQWRCNLYSLKRDSWLLFAVLLGMPVIIIFVNKLPVEQAFMTAITLVLVELILIFGTLALVAYSRSRAPRICKTSISSDGIHDVTPDHDKGFPWYQIKDIELCGKDVFFFVTPFGCIFVPGSAFLDIGEASEFFAEAKELWNAGR